MKKPLTSVTAVKQHVGKGVNREVLQKCTLNTQIPSEKHLQTDKSKPKPTFAVGCLGSPGATVFLFIFPYKLINKQSQQGTGEMAQEE